jgi:tetratricopeptide (TPR) repeat protein
MELTSRLLSSWHKPGRQRRDLHRYLRTLTLFSAGLCTVVGCGDPRFALLLKGYEQSEAGDDSSAFESYTAALRIDSTCSKAYFNRGVILLQWGQLYPAISELNSAIRYDPASTDAYRARASARKASLNLLSSRDSCPIDLSVQRTSRFATAVLLFRDLTRLVTADPYDVAVRADRVECAYELGDFESMQQDLDRALSIAPDDVWLLNRRGRLQVELGNYRDAIGDYTRALELCDTCMYILYNRALAMMEQGETREALNDLNRVLKRDPEDGSAWYARGRCLVALGQVSEGEICLEKAILLGVSDAALLLGRLRP